MFKGHVESNGLKVVIWEIGEERVLKPGLTFLEKKRKFNWK